jgi:hypothetical protein
MGGLSPEAPPKDEPTSVIVPLETTAAPPSTKLIATFSTPHIDQGPDGVSTSPSAESQNCGYQWAYQDLPELSAEFQELIRGLQPEAQANAYVFGENCVLADGTVARFLPMETDFNITLQVTDLSNESDLGEWIVKVMQVVDTIPPDQIVGPRPGRVSIIFKSNEGDAGINFYIDQYHALPAGLDHAGIYQALKTSQ